MCGRYFADPEEREMQTLYAALQEQAEVKAGEIFPTNLAPVITKFGELQAMRWGFPRFDGKGAIINARSETAAEKSMFRYPMQYGRCLIPASWYFEWEPAVPKKIKHAIQSAGPVTYLAGLSRVEQDGETTFVILTRQACSQIRYIHDRMPVILQPQFHDEWLYSKNTAGLFAHADTDVIVKE